MASTTKLLMSGAFLRVFILLVSVVSAFYLMPFIIHAIGDRWYGLWVIVGAVMGYYGLLDFGLASASQRFITQSFHSGNPQDINTAVSTSLGIFSLVSLFSMLVSTLIFFSAPFFFDSPEDIGIFRTVIAIMGIKVAVSFPFFAFFGIINGKLRYDIASYVQLLKMVLRLMLIIAYIGHGYSIIALAVITLSVELLGYLIIYYFARKLLPELKVGKQYFNFVLLKQYFHYGKFTFLASIGDVIRFQIDDLVIAKFLGLSMVSHYAIAIRLVDYAGQFRTSILGMFVPVFTEYYTKNDFDSLREKFLFIIQVSTALSLYLGCILLILGDDFIKIWMGKDYLDAYLPLAILTIGFVFAAASSPCVSVLYAIKKHKFYAYLTMSEALANLVLSISLVQVYGMPGVALGTAIPGVISKIYFQPRYTCAQLELSFMQYLMDFFMFSLKISPVIIGFYWINHIFPAQTYSLLFVYAVLFSTLYFLIVFKFILSANTKSLIEPAVPTRLKGLYYFIT